MASFEKKPIFAAMVLRLQSSWMFIAFFIGFFLFWEYAVVWFEIPRYILTPPSLIVQKGAADLDRLLYYTYVTGLEVVLGYTIVVVLALPLGLAIAFSSLLKRTIYPFIICIEMVPKIAFAPLFISWLGFGLLPKVIIVFLVCFFPIVLNAILAFNSLSEELTLQPLDRQRRLADVYQGPPAGRAAAVLCGFQICRDQRHSRRSHRRIYRLG